MRAARFAIFASALLFCALASTASAAVRPIDIAGFAFSPQSVTITVGDTITWTNRDTFQHSARVAGVGTTPTLSQGQSGSLIFNAAGTFPYDCGIHGPSMTGTIIVRAAATAPPTQPPTAVPTQAPTSAPTVAPTATPTPTAAATSAAPSASPTPSVAVAAPSQQAPAPAAANDGGGTAPLLIGGAVIALLAVAAFALMRDRR